jgi:hypothetical protein
MHYIKDFLNVCELSVIKADRYLVPIEITNANGTETGSKLFDIVRAGPGPYYYKDLLKGTRSFMEIVDTPKYVREEMYSSEREWHYTVPRELEPQTNAMGFVTTGTIYGHGEGDLRIIKYAMPTNFKGRAAFVKNSKGDCFAIERGGHMQRVECDYVGYAEIAFDYTRQMFETVDYVKSTRFRQMEKIWPSEIGNFIKDNKDYHGLILYCEDENGEDINVLLPMSPSVFSSRGTRFYLNDSVQTEDYFNDLRKSLEMAEVWGEHPAEDNWLMKGEFEENSFAVDFADDEIAEFVENSRELGTIEYEVEWSPDQGEHLCEELERTLETRYVDTDEYHVPSTCEAADAKLGLVCGERYKISRPGFEFDGAMKNFETMSYYEKIITGYGKELFMYRKEYPMLPGAYYDDKFPVFDVSTLRVRIVKYDCLPQFLVSMFALELVEWQGDKLHQELPGAFIEAPAFKFCKWIEDMEANGALDFQNYDIGAPVINNQSLAHYLRVQMVVYSQQFECIMIDNINKKRRLKWMNSIWVWHYLFVFEEWLHLSMGKRKALKFRRLCKNLRRRTKITRMRIDWFRDLFVKVEESVMLK